MQPATVLPNRSMVEVDIEPPLPATQSAEPAAERPIRWAPRRS